MERYGSGSIRIKKKQCHQTKVGACWLMTSSVVVLCFWQKKKKKGTCHMLRWPKLVVETMFIFIKREFLKKNPMKEKAYTPDYIYIMYHIELL